MYHYDLASVSEFDKKDTTFHMKTQTIIRPARKGDVPAIMTIAGEHALETKSENERRREGFLVSPFTMPDYRSWIGQATVIGSSLEVFGFLIAFQKVSIPSKIDDIANVETIVGDEDYLLIKQVAVARAKQGTGLGRLLYESVIRSIDRSIVAQIVLSPRNQRSISFHESMGFVSQGEYEHPDGMARGVWVHRANNNLGV